MSALMTITEVSTKLGYFIKIWVGYIKIQGEINLVRINNTLEHRNNEHGLYHIHRYRTLLGPKHLLRTSNFKFHKTRTTEEHT